VLQITQGALYRHSTGWNNRAGSAANGAKPRPGGTQSFISLTAAGRAQLEKELAQWERLSGAVGLVIRMAEK